MTLSPSGTIIYDVVPIDFQEDKPKALRLTILSKIQLIEAITWIMEDLIEGKGKAFTDESGILHKTPFHARILPLIPLIDYIARFLHFVNCQEDILIYAMIYLDRIAGLVADFSVNSFNVHK